MAGTFEKPSEAELSRLPKEKIIFVVDFLPLSATQFCVMADTYLPEPEDSMKKILTMDWVAARPSTCHFGPHIGMVIATFCNDLRLRREPQARGDTRHCWEWTSTYSL